MSAVRFDEKVSGLARDYQSIIRAVEAERDKFILKCFDQNSKIETLSKRAHLVEDKLLHRNVFAKQAVKTLRLVSKERDSFAARLKTMESEKDTCEGDEESSSNTAGEKVIQNKFFTKSQIPRSKECFWSENKLEKSTVSRYKVLPPLRPSKILPPALVPAAPLLTKTLAPTPPSLSPSFKRRATTKYSVPLTGKQPFKRISTNGELNPFKVLPPVQGKPTLSKIKYCIRRSVVQPRQRE